MSTTPTIHEFLDKNKLQVGDLIELTLPDNTIRGTVMPRPQLADDKHIVIKLKSGYNIGINLEHILDVKFISHGSPPQFSAVNPVEVSGELPRVAILSTGGTIASRVDYRTGAVHAALSAADLYGIVPELAQIAKIDTRMIYSMYSEDLTPKNWSVIAEEICRAIYSGVDGVVVTHGTDTMAYTAAALAFSLQGCPVPVVLVGAQRSSDRPSSDAAINLTAAVSIAARAPISGVYVAMHSTIGDQDVAIHYPTRVRKMHTSRRDAFKSISQDPAAFVRGGQVILSDPPPPGRRSLEDFQPKTMFSDEVALVKSYPGMRAESVEALKVRGLILEGTGLGHVPSCIIPSLKRMVKEGVFVGMTSQCIWGRVSMTVYETGRELLNAGVVPLEDMLAETALAKLSWVLANSSSPEEVKQLMRMNISREFSDRSMVTG